MGDGTSAPDLDLHLETPTGRLQSDSAVSPLITDWQELQQSDAVLRLRALLQNRCSEEQLLFALRTEEATKNVAETSPITEDLRHIMNQQEGCIQHLDDSAGFCKYNISSNPRRLTAEFDSIGTAQMEMDRRKTELDTVKSLHDVRMQNTESHINSLRHSLAEAQLECEELREKAYHAPPRRISSPALCTKCVCSQVDTSSSQQDNSSTIQRLTRERDELLEALGRLRRMQAELQRREGEACQRVTASLQFAEEACLERTKVQVENEQLRTELTRQKDQHNKELNLLNEKLARARTSALQEVQKEKELLTVMVQSLTQTASSRDAQLERMVRDRVALAEQLTISQHCSTQLDCQLAKQTSSEMRAQVDRAVLQKNELQKELSELRARCANEVALKDQEVERLASDLEMTRRAMESTRANATQASEEAVRLTGQLGHSKRKLRQFRTELDVHAKARQEEASRFAHEAKCMEEKIEEYLNKANSTIESGAERMDHLVTAQHLLIERLKEECNFLATLLEAITGRARWEHEEALQKTAQAWDEATRAKKSANELSAQCLQRAQLDEGARRRLQELVESGQTDARRMMELLCRQSSIVWERDLLSNELHFLKAQLEPTRLKTDEAETMRNQLIPRIGVS
uniref:serologically defined colon cancer antigen 8 n=1 Tax=Myxine glutinosa TaxID=7769 RepID=UPI00358EAD90